MDRGNVGEKQRAFGTETRTVRVSVLRRRGPAGLRDPIAVSLAALMGFTVLLSRFVGTQKIERLFFSYSGAFFGRPRSLFSLTAVTQNTLALHH